MWGKVTTWLIRHDNVIVGVIAAFVVFVYIWTNPQSVIRCSNRAEVFLGLTDDPKAYSARYAEFRDEELVRCLEVVETLDRYSSVPLPSAPGSRNVSLADDATCRSVHGSHLASCVFDDTPVARGNRTVVLNGFIASYRFGDLDALEVDCARMVGTLEGSR